MKRGAWNAALRRARKTAKERGEALAADLALFFWGADLLKQFLRGRDVEKGVDIGPRKGSEEMAKRGVQQLL